MVGILINQVCLAGEDGPHGCEEEELHPVLSS